MKSQSHSHNSGHNPNKELQERIAELHIIVNEDNVNETAWYELGMLYYKSQSMHRALECFMTAAELNPAGKGAAAVKMIQSILDFYNPDLLNP